MVVKNGKFTLSIKLPIWDTVSGTQYKFTVTEQMTAQLLQRPWGVARINTTFGHLWCYTLWPWSIHWFTAGAVWSVFLRWMVVVS